MTSKRKMLGHSRLRFAVAWTILLLCLLVSQKISYHALAPPPAPPAPRIPVPLPAVPHPIEPDEVLVMIMSGASTARERLPAMRAVFDEFALAPGVAVVIEADPGPDIVPPTWTVLETPHCGDGQTGALCCKTAFAMGSALRLMPQLKWVLRVCDDTYVHMSNVIPYLEHFDPDQPWYLGEKYVGQHAPTPYADGGAGWALSRGALHMLAPRLSEFYSGQQPCYDDVRFGEFMHATLGVPLFQASGFHNEPVTVPSLWLDVFHSFHAEHGGRNVTTRPITFHTRMGAQAGDAAAGRGDVDVQWLLALKRAVDRASAVLPVFGDADLPALQKRVKK